ncbi:Protein of unknown function [Gryllus bimaculatus]|nr:Protein of unknown function [Gryllus bimaculatus]
MRNDVCVGLSWACPPALRLDGRHGRNVEEWKWKTVEVMERWIHG